MFSGWSKWNLGIGDSEKMKSIKGKSKSKKKTPFGKKFKEKTFKEKTL
jgi:hypothetical protein